MEPYSICILAGLYYSWNYDTGSRRLNNLDRDRMGRSLVFCSESDLSAQCEKNQRVRSHYYPRYVVTYEARSSGRLGLHLRPHLRP